MVFCKTAAKMMPADILPEFQEFLLSRRLAPSKYVPFLAGWVSQFLAFSNRKSHTDINVLVAEFLDSLEANQNIADWQVRQANEALGLYLNHFKGGEALMSAKGVYR